MASSSRIIDQDLAFLIVQFLDAHNFKDSARMLQEEGKLYLNMKYVEEAVTSGRWKELEAYILRFTKIDENIYSLKLIFEIRRQKYIEVYDNGQHANAFEILANELQTMAPYHQDIFHEIRELKYFQLNYVIRENRRHYTDIKTARCSVFNHLKTMIENNPVLKDKLNYPSLEDSRLKILMNQSLNWQHTMCKYPELNPTVSTLFVDHTCGDAAALSLNNGNRRALANLTPCTTYEREMSSIPQRIGQIQLYSLRLPDPVLSPKIDRLSYNNSGDAILALTCSGVFKFWNWEVKDDNATGKATPRVEPPIFSANHDISRAGVHEFVVPCFALSKNDAFVASASSEGTLLLFSWLASDQFKILDTVMSPPSAATSVMFHPEDNNIIFIGMEDGSILIYDVRKDDQVEARIQAHQKRVTGFAYSSALNILVSSGYDAQVCAWNKFGWVKESAARKFLDDYGNALPPGHTCVKFHQDERHLLVVHESCLATLEGPNLEHCNQWVPGGSLLDAAYSCDGLSIYASFVTGQIVILDTASFTSMCVVNPSSYLPLDPRSVVYPCAIAPHPTKHSQFALGLSDGCVVVLEPQEGKWPGSRPQLQNVAA